MSVPSPHPEALISVSDAATRLAVSTRTVARLVADGDLASVKVRRRRLIPTTAVEGLMRKVNGANF